MIRKRRVLSFVVSAFGLVATLLLVCSPQLLCCGLSLPTETKTIPVLGGSAQSQSKTAVIVGGGPVGLATALTLSNSPHFYNVTILEKTASLSTSFDPSRAYLYNINGRGLQWIDQFPLVRHQLEARASAPASGMGQICFIPSDPDQPIPAVEEASTVRKVAPMKMRRSFWIPRHQMVQLLQECCLEQEETREQDSPTGSIQIVEGKQMSDLTADPNSNELQVACLDGSTYRAALVVAADGMDSTVRSCLKKEGLASSSPPSWLHANAKRFTVKRYRSPSTGLRMKFLQFPPGFELTNSTGERIPTDSETMYVFRGINQGTRNFLSLGLLPVKDPNAIRPANINTRYDHVVWGMTSGAAVKEFFQRNFPRVSWDKLVSDAEWDRFAKATGTTYPFCQYSPGSAVVSPSGDTGVALVGDACHAFPPDIGQGINAGLTDVVALDRALKGQDIASGGTTKSQSTTANTKDFTLGSALLAYQANRGPEHKALIQLARCGAPYQYRQPWIRDRIGRFLWTLNVALRMALNKLSGNLIPPAAILLAQDHSLTFRQVMRRATITSRSLKVLLAASLWILFRRRP